MNAKRRPKAVGPGPLDGMTTAVMLTEKEAAKRLSLCTRTMRKARQDGQLPYILIGRAVRYTVADLESYIERLRQVQPACQPAQRPARISGSRPKGGGVIIPFSERSARR